MAAFKDKKNGSWYVQFRYTDWRGERQQKLKRGFATKKEAQAWEREFLIILRLDRMMVERKMSLNELAERVGISNVNLSKIKNNKVTAIRFSTLAAICEALNCDAGDILEYREEDKA